MSQEERAPRAVVDLCVWMNMPSPHQEEFFRCLAAREDVRLHVIYHAGVAADRQAIGWRVTLEGYPHTFLRRPRSVHAVLEAVRRRRSVHLLNGIWAVPSFAAALLALCAVRSRPCFVYAEVSDPTRRRHPLRVLLRQAIGRLVARQEGVHGLAIARQAADQFRSLGFPEGRIHPFGYFRALPPVSQPEREPGQRLVFVGRLVPCKGLDVLLAALKPLWEAWPPLTLEIVGDGPERALVERYVATHPDARVVLRGRIPSDQIPEEVARHDLLVLPSRYDGWGLVVNEALAAGVPVAASTMCGASELVADGVNGYVFPAGDVMALRRCLERFLGNPPEEREALRRGARESGQAIHAAAVAEYLVGCIRHARGEASGRPAPPWQRVHTGLAGTGAPGQGC